MAGSVSRMQTQLVQHRILLLGALLIDTACAMSQQQPNCITDGFLTMVQGAKVQGARVQQVFIRVAEKGYPGTVCGAASSSVMLASTALYTS